MLKDLVVRRGTAVEVDGVLYGEHMIRELRETLGYFVELAEKNLHAPKTRRPTLRMLERGRAYAAGR